MLANTHNARNLSWLASLAIAAGRFDAAEAYLTELLAILLYRSDASMMAQNRKAGT